MYLLTLSLFIPVSVWLTCAHCLVVCPSPSLPHVCGHCDLNCNNIVNWGYCGRRSQADRQPLFPVLTSPHHSGKDTGFHITHLTVPYFSAPGLKYIKVEVSIFFSSS